MIYVCTYRYVFHAVIYIQWLLATKIIWLLFKNINWQLGLFQKNDKKVYLTGVDDVPFIYFVFQVTKNAMVKLLQYNLEKKIQNILVTYFIKTIQKFLFSVVNW